MRVMTWNIHAAIGPDRRYDLDRVIRLIHKHDPDILALQEVESRGRVGAHHPFRVLRQHFGPHYVEAPTLWDRSGQGERGYYGHLLLSRWPISRSALHDISLPEREPRTAIEAVVETPAGPLTVLAAHFGLRAVERRFQAARLAAMAATAAEPVLALGDFNEWAWRGAVYRRLIRVLPKRTRQRTFLARRPAFALDRIHARPSRLLGNSWTDPEAAEASDHLPVIAELTLAPLTGLPAVGAAPGTARPRLAPVPVVGRHQA